MNNDELTGLLVSWVEINSGSANHAGLATMLEALRTEFGRLEGAEETEVALPGTPAKALLVRMRPAAPRRILFSGHFDTVYDLTHPFQHCTRPGPDVLIGPGAADMKGGLVVMFAALRAFEQGGAAPAIGWDALLTPDEEIGSPHSAHLISEMAKDHEFALVFEPARANGDLVKCRMGTGIFTLIARGRAAHAGRDPQAGRNAIVALAEYLQRVDAMNREMPGVLLNVGRIRGGGTVNIVPDFAEAEVNIRIARAADALLVEERLREYAIPINAREGFALEIYGQFNRLPKEAGPAEEKLFRGWQACGRELGVDFSWQDVGGGSDGNLLSAAGLPSLDGLGPVGDRLHSPEEFIRLPSLVERARIAALFLGRFATGDPSCCLP